MRAMQLQEIGDGLEMADIAVTEPGAGQVRLRVHACGVNFADTLMVVGKYQEKPPLPFSPGLEVCGVVDAHGDGVSGPAIGTRVAVTCGFGGLAEFVCAPAVACVPLPDSVSDAEGAALQVAYGTSHVALDYRARLQPGETLLVTGAAGGVGLTAVEIGALMGATVIAVARGTERLERAGAMGAHHLIDSETADIRHEVKALGGADIVYDPVGGDQWEAAIRAAKPEARLIPIGFASGGVPQIPANILLVKNLTVIGLYWGAYFRLRPKVMAESLEQLLSWHAEGKIKPHISNVLPLEEANEALRLLRSREATGKVVVTCGR
ncbi:MAG: NADPH:quinone oxidoreductase family protein [Pseudomonadota bacterium]